MIRRFFEEAGAFQAEVAELSEGPIPDLPKLIQIAVKRFESYAAVREIRIPQVWPQLDQTRDPGRVADIIAARIRLPIPDKQSLLATLIPRHGCNGSMPCWSCRRARFRTGSRRRNGERSTTPISGA